jgi:hypothetical protein
MNPFISPVEAESPWWKQSRCSDPQTSWLFLKVEMGHARHADLVRVKGICANCPVLEQCRNNVLAVEAGLRRNEMVGVVAGMTAGERANLTKVWCRQCQRALRKVHSSFCEECSRERRVRRHREAVAS